MSGTINKRTVLWAALLMLTFTIAAPATFAQGRGQGRGQAKKAGKFKNGRNARDGRWDGRGPRGNRDDRYDDDDDYRNNDDDYRYNDDDYRYGRNRRTTNTGGYDNQAEARRQAENRGYQEGLRAGADDRARGRNYDLDSHSTYRDATSGYNNAYGDVEYYRSIFRQAYQQGYDEGYRNGTGRNGRSRVGTILGDILGRP